jgi:DNA modification methylase
LAVTKAESRLDTEQHLAQLHNLGDPPYALDRGGLDPVDRRVYRRDRTRVVGGYIDVDPGRYTEFTHRWITAATAALRPGGYLVVVTGAQQAARVQVTAEDAGLTYVNSITVARSRCEPSAGSPTPTGW